MKLLRASVLLFLVAASSCQISGQLYMTRDYINKPITGTFVAHITKKKAELVILQKTAFGITVDTFTLKANPINYYKGPGVVIVKNGKLTHVKWNDSDYVLYKLHKSKSTTTEKIMNLLERNYIVVGNEHSCGMFDLKKDYSCTHFECSSDIPIDTSRWYLLSYFGEHFIWHAGIGDAVPRVKVARDRLITTYCQRSGCKDYEARQVPK